MWVVSDPSTTNIPSRLGAWEAPGLGRWLRFEDRGVERALVTRGLDLRNGDITVSW